jgi:uncharacterized LabA/DUF88 family protein
MQQQGQDWSSSQRIAMLIDGDNAQPSLFGSMLEETGKYGTITIRRIYGDWTATNMGSWKDVLHNYAIQPIQQFRYTKGKNATDSAMIIDAIDILHSNVVDGFCIISSDSDYTRLCTRIRESGIFVMGIGKMTTPRSFVNACDRFVYTENLEPPEPPEPKVAPAHPGHKAPAVRPPEDNEDPMPLLMKAFDMAVKEDGWASLGQLGNNLRQLDPGFDPRTYHHKQLSLLIKAYSGIFRVQTDKRDGQMYVKKK